MKEKKIRRLIKIVEESNISELEISRWGRKVRISKFSTTSSVPLSPDRDEPTHMQPVPIHEEKQPSQPRISTEKALVEIRSPMVGTFYRAPAPDADPYVEVGDIIAPGQVLCIIEAMKLMNEIESEINGRIVEILVENAQPVEYNQVLFKAEPH